MTGDWTEASHVTKVDPAKALPSDLSVLEGTDLVIVGGSDGVTEANTLETVRRISAAQPELSIWQEPYEGDQVSPETVGAVDRIAVPAVYNGDYDHFVGKHVTLFAELAAKPREFAGSSLPIVGDTIVSKGVDAVTDVADSIVGEGYVVQNEASAAAEVSGVDRAYTPDEVAGAALATESFYGFPVFYVEYSGTYGDPADVEAAATYLEETALFYGGGIDSRERAEEMLAAGADAVVVGDIFHDDPDAFARTIP